MIFDKASTIIKDGNKLSFDYVPKEIVHREEQMHKLAVIFRSVIEDGRSETAFLVGNVGSGKTVTAKRFCSEFVDHCARSSIPSDYIIINCRQKSTEQSVLLSLVRHFDSRFPDRGFSSVEMLRSLRTHISKSNVRLVIVLDEVDVLIKGGHLDLVYQISRFNDDSNVKSSVSMILISQEYVLDKLDAASRSSFKMTNTIKFNKYTRDELKSIVVSRAVEALVINGYREDALDLIADISEEFGDARYAIDLLDKSARIAEDRDEGVLTSEDVRTAKAMTYSVVTESKLESLDKNRLIALLAICRAIKSKAYVPASTAEKTYAVVCEEYNTYARKHTQYWQYITDLEKLGLIKTNMLREKGEVGGLITNISLPDIPSKVLAEKLELILESEL